MYFEMYALYNVPWASVKCSGRRTHFHLFDQP